MSSPSLEGTYVSEATVDAPARAEDRIRATWRPRLAARHAVGHGFRLATLGAIAVALAALGILLYQVIASGHTWLTWDFITSFPSRFAAKAGIKAALVGSAYMAVFTALFAVPLGVGAAVYLEEFAKDTKLRKVIDVNIANLAGVPSIVYGMLGLGIFVRTLGLGRSIVAGSLTMSMLILPIIIVSAREALKAVPQSVRLAAFALGSTNWQAVRAHVLPAATPGILTGVILSMSRAAGETAPLILIGALNFVAFLPDGPMDSFTVLPIQIFNWASRPQQDFHDLAAAGIMVMIGVLVVTNGAAILIRQHYQGKIRW